MKIIHVLAIESHGAGEVCWNEDENTIAQTFIAAKEARPHATLTRFRLFVSADADDETMGRVADHAMWSLDYLPIETHIGTEGYVPGQEIKPC